MGLLGTRWKGHEVAVSRNEWTKGFSIEWDGTEIARRSWSWIGLGELRGQVRVNGNPAEVQVVLGWGGASKLAGSCTVTVDGENVPVERVA
jgi:hypothetical protein